MTLTTIFEYTQTKINPYAWLNKYRLVGVKSVTIFSNININEVLKNTEYCSSIRLEDVKCTLVIELTDDGGTFRDEEYYLNIDCLSDGEIEISTTNQDSIENDLMSNNDLIEVSKY